MSLLLRRIRLFFCSSVVSTVLWASSAWMVHAQTLPQEVAEGIMAVVADKIILKSEIEAEYSNWLGQDNLPDPRMKCVILEQLINNKLLLRQAEVDSIVVSDEEVADQLERRVRYFSSMVGGREKLEEFYGKTLAEIREEFRPQIKEQILVQRMQDKLSGDVSISPQEVRQYFESVPRDSIPYLDAELEIGQIVVFPEVGALQKELTLDKINGIRERILKGERFSTLATLYSEDPGSKQEGGSLGFFGRGEMVPEFEAAAFRLKPGEISPVVKTKFGYHIIELMERRGERLMCRHILIKIPTGSREMEDARKRLDSLRSRITKENTPFGDAVRLYSQDDETRSSGGMLMNEENATSRFTPEQLSPEIYFAIEKLKPGEYSEPQPYASRDGRQGYRILFLKSRSEAHLTNMKQDYPRIQATALGMKKLRKMEAWYASARQKTFVRVHPSYRDCENLGFVKK